ncbi:MAG: DUF5110 domain-containing protein [Muribaculum sp.]|nr:DUF5110 domain-containing protein [Muribaculum sp.]
MKTSGYLLPLLAGCGVLAGIAGSSDSPRMIRGTKGHYTVATPQKALTIDVIDKDIFRISALPADSSVIFPRSQSAVLTPQATDVRSIATDSTFVVATESTILTVDRNSGRVSFMRSDGTELITEGSGVDNDKPMKTVGLVPAKGQLLYGGGERGHSLTLNGDSLSMYNRQNYGYTGTDRRISQMGISVPWLSSDAGYGILFDDYNRAALLTRGDSIYYTSETPAALSYYFVNGNGTLAGNSGAYARLTGHQPLPPFWTLGYITSKYGYHNEKETLGAIDSLKQRGYPVDGIVLDLYWYGKETDMGRLEWNSDQFPDPQAMLRRLKDQGVHTVLINQPYVNKIGAIDNYNLLDSLGLLTKDAEGNTHDVTTWVGEAGMFDMANPATRRWLWNRLKGLTADGVSGWWGDLGEPEVHPLSIVHANGQTASQYHNVYGNEWSSLIYNGLRQDFPDMRPMLMMRGGTAGLQRYSVFPWTTDVSRSWGGLQPQIKLMLSAGLSGLGYMGSDVGGFAVDPKHPYDPELYLRWMQASVFTPVLRTHAQDKPEPYHYPDQQAQILELIKMRYRWLPYNYTLAYENARYGLPLARPLNFRGDNPDRKYADIDDEYLWGDNVLVAPVMNAAQRSRKVTFPKGTWYDWYNSAVSYKGGSTAVVKAPLDRLPFFIKAGSFIPQYETPIDNTGEYDPSKLAVVYFPAKQKSEYVLFDDDRKSPTSLEDGAYQLTTFRGVESSRSIDIEISSEGGYPDMPAGRMITMEIRNVKKKPVNVSLGDGSGTIKMDESGSEKSIRQYGWTYSMKDRTLRIVFPYAYTPLSLTIER